MEIWNFEKFKGANIARIKKGNLRLATEEEIKEYQIKFKDYCDNN